MPSSNTYSTSTYKPQSLEEKDLVVESLVESRILDNGQLQYLVKWQGSRQPTWEDALMWTPYTTDLEFRAPRPDVSHMVTHVPMPRPKSFRPSRLRTKVQEKSHQRKHGAPNAAPPHNSKQPDIVIDNEIYYEVEEIRNVRLKGRSLEYYIKWAGYPEDECTWEPEKHLTHAWDKLQEFYRKLPPS